MSDSDRPELRAFRELENLVRHLGEELAAFRRRAIAAETQLREAGQTPRGPSASSDRVAELDAENQALRARTAAAEDRVRQMLDRVRFLRQQLQSQTTVGGVRS
jgi:predicted  nucleic acid-binding Zn-ribbon protein